MPHLKIKPFSSDCGASPSALSMQTMQPMQPRLVLQQAVFRQSAVLACAASAAMACGAGAASAARSVEDSVCGAHGDASGDASAHREGRGQARGDAIAMGLCGPAPKHPRTPKAERGPPETGFHEGYNPTAEGAASDRWPGSKRCRCGGHAPGGFSNILGAEPLQNLQVFVNLLSCSNLFCILPWSPRDSLMLVCSSEVMVFSCFVATRLCILWISLCVQAEESAKYGCGRPAR